MKENRLAQLLRSNAEAAERRGVDFDSIYAALPSDGTFVTVDQIARRLNMDMTNPAERSALHSGLRIHLDIVRTPLMQQPLMFGRRQPGQMKGSRS